MKHICQIVFAVFLLSPGIILSQPVLFKENSRWGVKESGENTIPPVYDTIFKFDPSGRICLACYRTAGISANKFIKVYTVNYACNYLNRQNIRLSAKMPGNDTCTVFAFSKHSVKQYTEDPVYFVVSAKGKKNLVDKNFKQITFAGYHDISFSADPSFFVTQVNVVNMNFLGLINLKEELVIPYAYSEIKINPADSLIIACSAGIRAGSEDDIYNYQGKKIGSYRKHVDQATKNFVIHKLYEPKEHYIITNSSTKEEKEVEAEEIRLYQKDEILIRIKNDWYVYDMISSQKKIFKQS